MSISSRARARLSSRFWLACAPSTSFLFFFFNDTATTEIYTLSLHDALPILMEMYCPTGERTTISPGFSPEMRSMTAPCPAKIRSEEHTSELQSHLNLVCRLLLEKKKKKK